MLNRWQTAPLILAGIWTPNVAPNTAPSVQVAVDAAEALDEEGVDPLAGAEPAPIPASPAGLQYLRCGLLNEDEALRLILQGKSFGSESSSTTASPVGTPVTTSNLAVRVVKKGAAKRSEKTEFEDQNQKPVGNSESPLLLSPGNTESSTNDETLYLSAVADQSFDAQSSSASANVTATTVAEKTDDSDSEVEDSIYSKHRISLQEDSENVPDNRDTVDVTTPAAGLATEATADEVKEAAADTDSQINSLESNESTESTSSNKLEANNGTAITNTDDQAATTPIEVVTTFERPTKRRNLKSTSSSTTSSRESGTSLNLAIPNLAGFIESWNPFGSGRFFDTPPANAAGHERFGFTLKPDVRVGALNEADSQELMKVFDQVIHRLPRIV